VLKSSSVGQSVISIFCGGSVSFGHFYKENDTNFFKYLFSLCFSYKQENKIFN
jgi:hypothetical protein